jgi:hypothetical protein
MVSQGSSPESRTRASPRLFAGPSGVRPVSGGLRQRPRPQVYCSPTGMAATPIRLTCSTTELSPTEGARWRSVRPQRFSPGPRRYYWIDPPSRYNSGRAPSPVAGNTLRSYRNACQCQQIDDVRGLSVYDSPSRAVAARPPSRGGGTPAVHPGRAPRGARVRPRPALSRDPHRSGPRPRWSGGGHETGAS